MILYTVMAPEDIFFSGAGPGLQGLEVPETVETYYRGVKVLVHPVADGRARLVRILCTDPNSYLDPGLAPGTIIDVPLSPPDAPPYDYMVIPPFAI